MLLACRLSWWIRIVFDVFEVKLLELLILKSRQRALHCSLIDDGHELLLSVTKQI